MYNVIEFQKQLFSMRDEEYKKFNSRLIPNVDPDKIIGIRTPQLRSFAKQFGKSSEAEDFLHELPHRYYEENNIHAFLLEQIKDADICIESIDAFLPYVDNWATCDMMSPKVFKKYPDKILSAAYRWIDSTHTYTIRFGIKMIMEHFLDERFEARFAERVAEIRSEEYYINMMIAWFFATALAKQYDAILPFIEQKKLSEWVHNKTIQKACESYRITDGQKEHLRTLRIKTHR